MGQHWVQVTLLIGGRVDPANPQILEYASIGDRKVLVGVAYAIRSFIGFGAVIVSWCARW